MSQNEGNSTSQPRRSRHYYAAMLQTEAVGASRHSAEPVKDMTSDVTSHKPHQQSQHTAKPKAEVVVEDEVLRTLYILIHGLRYQNVTVTITKKHLWNHFQDVKKDIQRCDVIFHQVTGLPKGFGFVVFKTREAASRAIRDYQGTMLDSRHKLDLSFKTKKGVRSAPPPVYVSRPQILPRKEKDDIRFKDGLLNTALSKDTMIVKKDASVPVPVPRPQILPCEMAPDDSIIEFKDEVIGLMNTALSKGTMTVIKREKVELYPLLPPQLGFQMKGTKGGVGVVKTHFRCLRESMLKTRVGYAQIVLDDLYQPMCFTKEVICCRDGLKRDLKVVTMCSFEKHSSDSSVSCQVGVRVGRNHVTLVKIVVGRLDGVEADAIVIPTGRAICTKDCYPIQFPSVQSRTLCNAKNLVEIGQTEILDGGMLPCSYIIHALFPSSAQDDNESCDIIVENSLLLATQMNLGSITFPGVKTQLLNSIVDGLSTMGSTSLHTVTVVLGMNFEAKRYDTALQSLVNSSTGQRRHKISQAEAIASPTASAEYTWSWRDNDGTLIPYTQEAMDALNESYNKNGNGICPLSINGMQYYIHFGVMRQVNMHTKNQRHVFKTLNAMCRNHVAQSHVIWNYRGDAGRFVPYSAVNCANIEAMFQHKDIIGKVSVENRTYNLDFHRMEQVNAQSGYQRDIQRVDSQSSHNHKGHRFLPHDQIVVNIKGPLENLVKAKDQLERKIKSLMFSKTIPLSVKVAHSLQVRAKGIADKYHISSSSDDQASLTSQRVLKLEGLEDDVKKALIEVQELIITFQVSSEQLPSSAEEATNLYPQEWKSMSDSDTVMIVPLPLSHKECVGVCQKFAETMGNVYVIRVQRVQNKQLWNRYAQSLQRLHKKNAGNVNEKRLFHGTRKNPAENICRSEEGFDMRLSHEGMWGQANYFAVKAEYSNAYAYHSEGNDGTKELILARVATGDSYQCSPDSSLRMPPEKHQSTAGGNQLQQVRYDSVNGTTQGSAVYMTYANDLAYPAYIITYSKTRLAPATSTSLPWSLIPASSGVQPTASPFIPASSGVQPTASPFIPASSGVQPPPQRTTTTSSQPPQFQTADCNIF